MREWPHVVVIGTSVGGHQALQQLLSGLPPDFAPPIFIVMHIGAHKIDLPQMFQQNTPLPIRYATDNDRVEAGTILLAPPDQHMLLSDGVVRLSRAPKENFSRPAVDPLFRTAAFAYRERVVGVVLTGNLDDGTIGLQAIKACGGITVVQDPATAVAPDMPRSALDHVDVDYCLPLDAIADKLVQLAKSEPVSPISAAIPHWIPVESKMNLDEGSSMEELDKIGHQSKLTCPECNGVLWEIDNPNKLRFRCHTGHSFTGEALDFAQNVAFEEAIWFAIRALHEKQRLLKRLADSAREGKREGTARDYEESAAQAAQHAGVLQRLVVGRQSESA